MQYLDVNLDDIRTGQAKSWLFSHNRPNVYAIHDKDHYSDANGGVTTAIPRLVSQVAPELEVTAIRMITQPSFLGYVFNPVSFFIVANEENNPAMVIIEVHNRVGQQHLYLLRRSGEDQGEFTTRFKKNFFVSPFLEPDGEYRFSMSSATNRLGFALDLHQGGNLVLSTRLDLRAVPLNDSTLLKAMTTHSLVPQKTVGAIYLQALKLKLKGAQYRRPSVKAPEEFCG